KKWDGVKDIEKWCACEAGVCVRGAGVGVCMCEWVEMMYPAQRATRMLIYYAPAGALQGADLREKEITKSSANMAVHITEGLQITAETHVKVSPLLPLHYVCAE